MAILLDRSTRVLVQGITGSIGQFQTGEMLGYGTKVVGGVSPGKGGGQVHGVPVFDTVRSAVERTGAEMSILFIHAMRAKDAIYEAMDAGLRRIVCVAEFMPVHDSLEIKARARRENVRLIGPNCSGLITPGQAKVGFYCDEVCIPGDVGLVSKSGTLSYAVLLELKRRGIGASTCVGVGGDEIKGTTVQDCVEMFEADSATRATVIIGEVGGREEEQAADYIGQHAKKPIVAYIAGRTIPPGRSIGHAGAMIVGEKGTFAGKLQALNAAGVRVASTIEEIPTLLSQ